MSAGDIRHELTDVPTAHGGCRQYMRAAFQYDLKRRPDFSTLPSADHKTQAKNTDEISRWI